VPALFLDIVSANQNQKAGLCDTQEEDDQQMIAAIRLVIFFTVGIKIRADPVRSALLVMCFYFNFFTITKIADPRWNQIAISI